MSRLSALLVLIVFNSLPLNAVASDDVAKNQLLTQMITVAGEKGDIGRTEKINALRHQIEALNVPMMGDHTAAVKSNEQGLQAFKSGQYDQAKQFWCAANKADPNDVAIASNLGFIYLKFGDWQQALKVFYTTLGLAPSHSLSWIGLAEYFAVQNKTQQAAACYALAFHFSENQEEVRRFLQQQTTIVDDPKVQQAEQQALQLSLIRGKWNITDTNAISNGNIQIAIGQIKSNPIALSGATESTDAALVIKAPWRYYGQTLCFNGDVNFVVEYPPDSSNPNPFSGGSEVIISTQDQAVVSLVTMENSGLLKPGDLATVCGLPVGRAEVTNNFGGKITCLVIVGVIK